ncbi:hypothetical protein [Polycladomyces subterraneus]|uniref:Uncharacterized protein n=1 Tax=Polycladomyces subterraneus TaxID=1016997 RepID=A0ABT8IIP0_9BACL|nr:hypothetical protein [Polycladomyces subterraneus]MDN4592644.1 hypothetical protein [Polycladomyces subterraneus]
MPMFFHGIPFVHLVKQFPVLQASNGSRKSPDKRQDARRLIERIGFEPVHLLRSSPEYSIRRCLRECLQYGDTVFAFSTLPFPRVQLSPHEWGVRCLQLHAADWAVTTDQRAIRWIREHFHSLPVLFCQAGKPPFFRERG